ncbi:MAG: hypothetical protein IK012_05040 [Fibrobacter sp.]|uniref:hypothetical protein n=1 Tax=Fibrobacter sp. TaxID=35828 RepID=UPI0025B8C1B6|nr:hypothetical protein [Fibrobacter sp.]MBR4784605.1 hypothetical protein [Fibrobacter sp.]
MFDIFLQKDVEKDFPDCGGLYAQSKEDAQKGNIIYHFDEIEIKDSTPISRDILSAFRLLANDKEESFFSLCDDPENLDRNPLERFLQKDIEQIRRNDPLTHLKEVVARPILDLKEEEIKQPTSRVKKFAPRALEYLAGHSEDWRNRSFVGVHPQRILSLVRDDKWETYENRLMYTLCKILISLINQRLQELKNIDNAYYEIELYYQETNNIDFNSMGKELNFLLNRYSQETVKENRDLLKQTIDFLKYLQRSISAFWNSPLFNNLKTIPNIEVDINHDIMTNVLMNNQHYSYLPKIQKEVKRARIAKLSKTEKKDEQVSLRNYEKVFVKRCINDFKKENRECWTYLELKSKETPYSFEFEAREKKLRFVFVTSKPTSIYESCIPTKKTSEVSVLVYPQSDPYLNDNGSNYFTIQQMFKDCKPYMILGISPQSIFSKLLIQRIILQWAWPILMHQYPFEITQNRFIKDLVPTLLNKKFLLESYDIKKFKNQVDEQERTNRVQKRDLYTYRKNCDEDIKILEAGNTLVNLVLTCPCCKSTGKLHDGATNDNFLVSCNNCHSRWSRNGNKIKWSFKDTKLHGKWESFELKI